ncbi:MAG: chitobiase/beta-hexosaminidase C-terminal domain-containing protein [Eubacterium ramulus]
MFDQYLLAAPEIDKEGGNYNEFLEVTLSVDGKGMDIYYTLDGSVPTDADKKYEDPIQIEEQGKTTLTAIAMDKNGKYSEPVSAEYNIELDAPDMPSVYPDGGTYHEQKSVL